MSVITDLLRVSKNCIHMQPLNDVVNLNSRNLPAYILAIISFNERNINKPGLSFNPILP